MRNAERGASQIPLVICVVLLLVAGFFAYTQYSEKESMDSQLKSILAAASSPSGTPATVADVKSKIAFAMGIGQKYRQRLEDILPETGGTDTEDMDLVVSPKLLRATTQKFLDALDRGNFVVEFPVDLYKEDKDGGGTIVQKDAGGKVVVNYGGTKDLKGGKPDMTNVFEYVVTPAMTKMIYDIKRLREATATALAAKDAAEASYKTALAAKEGEIKAKVDELGAMESSKSLQINDLRRQIGDAEAAKAASEEEKNKTVTALTNELKMAKGELEKAMGTVQVLKSQKRSVEIDTSPDGAVLSVGDKLDFAVIDLGRVNNNLLAGTNFEVYTIGKGGMEIHKGTIKVTKVDGTTSECRVLDMYDAFNPIAPGDKIRSVFYSPKETVHVALVGRFIKMGKSDAARRLQSLGVVVDEKVTTQTTYLIVGEKESDAQPIEETVEFKAAELWGIPHISEKELSKFTMY